MGRCKTCFLVNHDQQLLGRSVHLLLSWLLPSAADRLLRHSHFLKRKTTPQFGISSCSPLPNIPLSLYVPREKALHHRSPSFKELSITLPTPPPPPPRPIHSITEPSEYSAISQKPLCQRSTMNNLSVIKFNECLSILL